MGEQELEKKLKPEELVYAENFVEEGEFDKALKLLNIFEKKKNILYHDKLSCYHLMGQILIWKGNYEEAIKISEEMYNISQLYKYELQSIDALILLSHIYTYQYNDDMALDKINQSENLLEKVSKESSEILLKREAHLFYCKGLIYFHKGNIDQAFEYLERSLILRKELGNKQEIAESLYSMARILAYNGEFDRAFNILEHSLTFATESKSIFYMGLNYNTLGVIYLWKGKINQSLKNFEKSLAIFKKVKNNLVICGLLNNISEAYYLKGNLNQALNCLEHSLLLENDIDIGHLKISTLDTAIQFALEIKDTNRALEYFHELEKINDQEDSKKIKFIYLYNKALILKSSSLNSNQIRAREILKKIVEKKIPLLFETSVRALLNLCDILLTELHETTNLELLDQIQIYINQILGIARNQKLYWLLVESYLLEVILDLIKLDLKKAQKTLIEAQRIAEKYGMNQLVGKISIEQNKLYKQKNRWFKLKDSDKTIIELANLIPLKEQLSYMLKKREIFKKFNI
ncbi:MAG: tetratricopeptide repeat protein [Promethearchaeota archaeon]